MQTADSSGTMLMQLVVLYPFSYSTEIPFLQLWAWLLLWHITRLYALFFLYAEKIIAVIGRVSCDKLTIVNCKCSFFHDSGNSFSSRLLREDQAWASSTKGHLWNNSAVADPASVNEFAIQGESCKYPSQPQGKSTYIALGSVDMFSNKGWDYDALQVCI